MELQADMASVVSAGAAHFSDERFQAAGPLQQTFDQQSDASLLANLTEPVLLAEQRRSVAAGTSSLQPDKDDPQTPAPPKFVDVGSIRNRMYGKLRNSIRVARDKLQECLKLGKKNLEGSDGSSTAADDEELHAMSQS